MWHPDYFIIYIDNTSKVSPSSSISLFADDIALYHSDCSLADFTALQSDITAISMRIEGEKYLQLHADKCCCMFIPHKKALSLSLSPPPSDSVKYLGLILTSDLSWTDHISMISKHTVTNFLVYFTGASTIVNYNGCSNFTVQVSYSPALCMNMLPRYGTFT